MKIDSRTETTGDNALHLAVKSNNLDLIEELIRCRGAQELYSLRNYQGLRPIDYMKQYCRIQYSSGDDEFQDIRKLLMSGTKAVTGVAQRNFS